MLRDLSTAEPTVSKQATSLKLPQRRLETMSHQETHTSTPSCFRISDCSLSLILTPA